MKCSILVFVILLLLEPSRKGQSLLIGRLVDYIPNAADETVVDNVARQSFNPIAGRACQVEFAFDRQVAAVQFARLVDFDPGAAFEGLSILSIFVNFDVDLNQVELNSRLKIVGLHCLNWPIIMRVQVSHYRFSHCDWSIQTMRTNDFNPGLIRLQRPEKKVHFPLKISFDGMFV